MPDNSETSRKKCGTQELLVVSSFSGRYAKAIFPAGQCGVKFMQNGSPTATHVLCQNFLGVSVAFTHFVTNMSLLVADSGLKFRDKHHKIVVYDYNTDDNIN